MDTSRTRRTRNLYAFYRQPWPRKTSPVPTLVAIEEPVEGQGAFAERARRRACMLARPRRGSDRAPRLRLSQAPVGPAAETSVPLSCRGKFSLLLEGMATKLTAAQLAARLSSPLTPLPRPAPAESMEVSNGAKRATWSCRS